MALDSFFEISEDVLEARDRNEKRKKGPSVGSTIRITDKQKQELDAIMEEYRYVFKFLLTKIRIIELAIDLFMEDITIEKLNKKLKKTRLVYKGFDIRQGQDQGISKLSDELKNQYGINLSRSAIVRIAIEKLLEEDLEYFMDKNKYS